MKTGVQAIALVEAVGAGVTEFKPGTGSSCAWRTRRTGRCEPRNAHRFRTMSIPRARAGAGWRRLRSERPTRRRSRWAAMSDRRRGSGGADGHPLGEVGRARDHRRGRPVRASIEVRGARWCDRLLRGRTERAAAQTADSSGRDGFDIVVDTTGNPAVFAAGAWAGESVRQAGSPWRHGLSARQCLSSDMMTKG